MSGQRHGETISQFAIRTAWELGHFWNKADNPDGANLKQEDLVLLRPEDPVVVKAMISLSKMDSTRYTRLTLEKHGRPPDFDGVIGPAILAMVTEGGRCPVPDYAPPAGTMFAFDDPDIQKVAERLQKNATMAATGSGSWSGCHGIGDYHSASIRVDDTLLPSFLKPVFKQVLANVQRAYAGVGLLWRFINRNGVDLLTGAGFAGNINSEMSFVNSSSGWIGLAIVGQNETCGSKIWCKFLNTYRGGSTDAAVIQQWTTLLKHELGHNCGRSHTNGGVMNPSIVNGLSTEWGERDPSTAWLQGQFGGVAVPIPGGGPTPPVPGPVPTTTEQQIRELQIKNIVQDVTLTWCVDEIKKLKSKG